MMIQRVVPLIAGYSIFVAVLFTCGIYSTEKLQPLFRFPLTLVLFCLLIAIALIHIRSRIGNKINYLVACISALSTSGLAGVVIVLLAMVLEHSNMTLLLFF
jgi:hypothetical protein